MLISNAAIGIVGPVESAPIANFNRTMAINLRGQYLVSRAVAPHMLLRGYSRLIFMSLQAGVIGLDDHTAYSASQAGVLGTMRCMAIEWAGRGVTLKPSRPP